MVHLTVHHDWDPLNKCHGPLVVIYPLVEHSEATPSTSECPLNGQQPDDDQEDPEAIP